MMYISIFPPLHSPLQTPTTLNIWQPFYWCTYDVRHAKFFGHRISFMNINRQWIKTNLIYNTSFQDISLTIDTYSQSILNAVTQWVYLIWSSESLKVWISELNWTELQQLSWWLVNSLLVNKAEHQSPT